MKKKDLEAKKQKIKRPLYINKSNCYIHYFSSKISIIKKLCLIELTFFIYILNSIKSEYISEIELTIKGTGYQHILSSTENRPSEIIVNGVTQNSPDLFCANMTNNINTVLISFNSPLINCSKMFRELINITKIAFLKFDSNNQKIKMTSMFNGCKSLTSIDFNSINTLYIESMDSMFYNCISLMELDLSHFNTVSVIDMNHLFYNCYWLKHLNMSNLDTSYVTDMSHMFNHCNSLESLDLSGLNTISLNKIQYMFNNCTSLISLNLSNFNILSVSNMNNLFYECISLKYLNLSSFKSSNCSKINYMFTHCRSLISLDISNLNTSLITEMKSLFQGCNSLTFINLSNFDTSNVKDMNSMFSGCGSLLSLDLSKFVTSSVTDMSAMFYGCSSLIYIDLNNFNISESTKIDTMFSNCNRSLVYCFDNKSLHNFTHRLTSFNIINNCSSPCFQREKKIIFEKKQCIDKCSNDISNKKEYNNVCYKFCPKRTKSNNDDNICEDFNCENYYNYEQNDCENEIPDGYYLNDSTLKTIDKCHPDCKTCKGKEIINNSNCNSCIESKFLDSGNCVDECEYGFFRDLNGNNICKCSYICSECPPKNVSDELCISCNTDYNYYKKFEDIENKLTYIKCYNKLEGYFLKNETFYKCHKNCKNCSDFGNDTNNNCIECILGYDLKENKNCYEKCQYYYYFDEFNEYKCTNSSKCPYNYSKYINEKKECINSCEKDDLFKYEYNNICYISCPNGTHNSSVNEFSCEKDIISIKNMTNPVNTTENQNTSNITQQENIPEIIIGNNITNINDEGNISVKKNISNTIYEQNIKESLISDIYTNNNLSNFINIYLYINCSDDIINNIRNNIINRSLDSYISKNIINEKKDIIMLNDTNLLLQITSSENQNNNDYEDISSIILGKCEKILKEKYGIDESQTLIIFKIDYFQPGSLIPIIGYEIFHPETKKKLSLEYCKDELIEYNIPLDINEENLFMYDPNSEYYRDQCYPSTTDSGTDILINDRQNEFNSNNMSICENNCTLNGYHTENKKVICECGVKPKQLIISELINQTDLLSYNFTNKAQSSNMITMKCYYTLFTKNGLLGNIGSYILLFTILLFMISSILFYKCGYNLLEDEIRDIIDTKEEKFKLGFDSIKKINIPKKKRKGKKDKGKIKYIKKKKMKKKMEKRRINKNHIISNNSSEFPKSFSKLETNVKEDKIFPKHVRSDNQNKNSIIYNDYEMNSFSYEEAIQYDKRTFCKYYISLIRTKQLIIFSFCPINDYNSRIVKIDLFFLSFSIYSFINCLFFDEKTIHKIYEDEGIYNFIYLVPYILYSFIISNTLFIIIKYFALSEKNISEIKLEKTLNISYDIRDKAISCIKIKYICFYCLSILFLLFFWYYLSSFGAVYKNTQIYLIKNILISFGFALSYPFIVCLFPSIFRIYALKNNNDKVCFYKISKIIQLL